MFTERQDLQLLQPEAIGLDTISSVDPQKSVFERREKLCRSFHHRFNALEQELADNRPVNEANLGKLFQICQDPDFSFSERGVEDFRTPLSRVFTLTTVDSNLNFGFSRLPWVVEHNAVAVISDAVVGHAFGNVSTAEAVKRITLAGQYLADKELPATGAIVYGRTATDLAMRFLEVAVDQIDDLNGVLLDPSHKYLTEMHNTAVMDFLIDHGLKALDSEYRYEKNGPYASPSGLKLEARLIIADTVLPHLDPIEMRLAATELCAQMKPFVRKCVSDHCIFQLEDGHEPCDAVTLLLYEYASSLPDDCLLALLHAAKEGGYFSALVENNSELMDVVFEGFLHSCNSDYYYDVPFPVETVSFLIANGVHCDRDHLLFLRDVERDLKEELDRHSGDPQSKQRAFLVQQKSRISVMSTLVTDSIRS